MFKITPTAHGYKATLESSGDTYFCGHVKPTEGYPKKAKYPYKADVSLMKQKANKEYSFIPLSRSDSAARTIISALMPELCAHIKREQDLAATIKQEEEEKYSLMEQFLDD